MKEGKEEKGAPDGQKMVEIAQKIKGEMKDFYKN